MNGWFASVASWMRRLILAMLLSGAVLMIGLASPYSNVAAAADCNTPTSSPCPTPGDSSAVVKPNPGDSVIKLRGAPNEDGSVQLDWTMPPPEVSTTQDLVTSAPNSSKVYRGSDVIATLNAGDSPLGISTYNDPRPPQQADPVTYYVAVYFSDGSVEASSEVAVKPVPLSEAAAPLPAAGSQGATGTDAKVPDFKGENANTAFDEYGGVSLAFINGTDDLSWQSLAMMPMIIGWALLVAANYSFMIALSWAVSTDLYKGIVVGIAAIVQVIFGLDVYKSITALALGMAALSIGALVLNHKFKQVGKAFGFVFLGLILTASYTLFSGTIVSFVLEFPPKAAQYVLGYGDQMAAELTSATGQKEYRFQVSIVPTYKGDPWEQGIRHFEDREFLNTVYAGDCMETFGDLGWATSVRVPNRTATPANGFDNLTPCEYFVRSQKLGDQDEIDYLNNYMASKAPGNIASQFRGENVARHYAIMFFVWWGVLFRTLVVGITAYSIAVCVFTLAFWLLKAIFVLPLAIIPNLRPFMLRLFRQTSINMGMPPLLALVLIFGAVVSTMVFSLIGQLGWIVMMTVQVMLAIGAFVAVILLRRAAKKQNRESRESLPEVSSRITDFAEGANVDPEKKQGRMSRFARKSAGVAAAAYTGGTTAVVASAAKGVGTNTRRAASKRLEPAVTAVRDTWGDGKDYVRQRARRQFGTRRQRYSYDVDELPSFEDTDAFSRREYEEYAASQS